MVAFDSADELGTPLQSESLPKGLKPIIEQQELDGRSDGENANSHAHDHEIVVDYDTSSNLVCRSLWRVGPQPEFGLTVS